MSYYINITIKNTSNKMDYYIYDHLLNKLICLM